MFRLITSTYRLRFLLVQTTLSGNIGAHLLLENALIILLCKLREAHVQYVQHHDRWKRPACLFHTCEQITHRWLNQQTTTNARFNGQCLKMMSHGIFIAL